MRPSKKTLIITAISIVICLVFCAGPLIASSPMKYDSAANETQIASINDYKLHTTPLPAKTVEDICQKLGIEESSKQCRNTATTYAPELFDEIEEYFKSIPEQARTYEVVENKLGPYLDFCEDPNPDGRYRCLYDLNGDRRYPIGFYFDQEGYYYRIIANTTGWFGN